MAETTGIILAGGRSSRFGTNKSLALYKEKPLIIYVAHCLEPLFPKRLLVTDEPDQFTFLGWPMTGDYFRDCGPLAGIHAALTAIDTEQGFVTGSDMPLIKSEFIRAVCDLPGEWDVALPWLPSGPEPLHAVYRRGVVGFLEEQLTKDHYKIVEVLKALRLHTIDLDELNAMGGDVSLFYNINQKRDLAKLQKQDTPDEPL